MTITGGIIHDILLLYGLVLHWDPRSGSVARFLGLGKASLAWEWHFLDSWPCLHWDPRSGSVARIVHKIPDGPIYAGKTMIFDWKPGFPWKFLGFSSNFSDFLGHALEILRWTLQKTGCEVDFGRRGKLTCHRIDELFKQNWPPETQNYPRRPSRRPSRSF